jgi:hypothetical protein
MDNELPEDIKADIIKVAGGLGPVQIVEGLEELIDRNKYLLTHAEYDPFTKEVIIHELAVLTAAVYGYRQSVKEFHEKIDKATVKG